MIDRWRACSRTLVLAGILMGVAPSLLHAQDTARTRHVSLDEAVHMAEQVSQPVAIARAGVALASGQQTVARSQILPQITGQLSYTRTLATQFASLGRSTTTTPTQAPPPDCTPFADNPAWTPEQRTDSLEAAVNRALECPVAGNPFTGVSNLPFGQANQYQFGFNISQNLFAGGANIARIHAAN